MSSGAKPDVVRALGATFHDGLRVDHEFHMGRVADVKPLPDVIVEATGVPQVVLDAIEHNAPAASSA